MTLRLSSSLPNNPKFANGRVYYDNLVKRLAADGLADRIDVQFFPDNQLGQEIDVVNSVSLGVIDLMVTGTSIWANVVPLIGLLDLGYLFESFPQQTKALDAGAAKPLEQALKPAPTCRSSAGPIISAPAACCANRRSTRPRTSPARRIRTLPNKIITECLRLMGAAATPMAFGEIYTALQAGVLDGLEHDPPTIVASKFYETAKFYSLTQHNFSALGVFCSGLTLTPDGGAAARLSSSTAAAEAAVDTQSARARGRKGGDGDAEAKGRRNHRLRSRAVPQAACCRRPTNSSRRIPKPSRSSTSSAAPRREAELRGRLRGRRQPGRIAMRRFRGSAAERALALLLCWSTRSPRSCWRRT